MSPNAIVRADGLFETTLGILLVVGAAAGWLNGDDFPAPVGTALIVVVGVALLAIGAGLWRLGNGDVPRQLLRTLAIANSVTAVAAIVWRVAADGFSSAGSAVLLLTAGALLALASLQAGTARRR
jgi:uncharacterized membrane protein